MGVDACGQRSYGKSTPFCDEPNLNAPPSRLLSTVGLLLSGGLDSCVLLAQLLAQGRRVQPFYIRTDVVWAAAELAAIRRFLQILDTSALADLQVFDLPLADLYQDHWSISGLNTPDADTPDEAVYLPGRNALLALKPLIWCQAHQIEELALAVLAGNPFADAQPEFLNRLASAMSLSQNGQRVTITRPLAQLSKDAVLRLGHGLPLEHTFSCISPRDGLHCGECNKCEERRAAFRRVGLTDATVYAPQALAESASRSSVLLPPGT